MTAYLVHGRLPRRTAPVNIAYVTTHALLKDYAAGGFHVSVKLGQAVENPVQSLWNDAAAAYVAAYEDDGSLARGLKFVWYANTLADKAYAAQGKQQQPPDIAVMTIPGVTTAGFPFLPVVVAGIAYWIFTQRKKLF